MTNNVNFTALLFIFSAVEFDYFLIVLKLSDLFHRKFIVIYSNFFYRLSEAYLKACYKEIQDIQNRLHISLFFLK